MRQKSLADLLFPKGKAKSRTKPDQTRRILCDIKALAEEFRRYRDVAGDKRNPHPYLTGSIEAYKQIVDRLDGILEKYS